MNCFPLCGKLLRLVLLLSIIGFGGGCNTGTSSRGTGGATANPPSNAGEKPSKPPAGPSGEKLN
jgi:hypothetical protein